MICGKYNVPGYPDSRIISWTEKPLRDLFALCLVAMGGRPVIVMRPRDRDARPLADWTAGVDPFTALNNLCAMYDYLIIRLEKTEQLVVRPRETENV